MSLDGKIAAKARGPVKLGTAYDLKRMSEIRGEHDAVINGATTFRAHPYPLHVRGRRGAQPISAIVSSNLRIPRNTPWENAVGHARWVFCGRGASRARAKALEKKGVRVIWSRFARPSPREILAEFRRAGLRRVLLEGGGEFNASFLEAGLVNTIYLTLTPRLIGGAESPTWFEGAGFARGHFPRLRLRECRRRGHEIYLVYAV